MDSLPSSPEWSRDVPCHRRAQELGACVQLPAKKLFFDNDYVAAEHSFDTTRKARWIADSLAIPGLRLTSPPAATREQLLDVHSAEYVDAVISGEPAAFVLAGGYVGDGLTKEELVALHVATITKAHEIWARKQAEKQRRSNRWRLGEEEVRR